MYRPDDDTPETEVETPETTHSDDWGDTENDDDWGGERED